jgi:competence transcription factor ComK
MTFLDQLKPKTHYADKTPLALTPEEQQLFFGASRRQINVWINEQDLRYIQENDFHMTRIVFFLVHEWLEKKKQGWDQVSTIEPSKPT